MSARRSTRRHVFDISIVICATDLVYGMVAPTFSLYVDHLGGSAFVVGLLAGAASPVGSLADRWGPKIVLVCGLFLFFGSCALFTVPSNPLLLALPRVLFGLAIVATFPLGVAYIGDFVRSERRTLAISIYVSAQGLGYAIGPILGSALAASVGFHVTYRVAATLALATAALAFFRLRRRPKAISGRSPVRSFRSVLGRGIAAASIANLVMMLMFNGAVIPFLSLYAASLGIGTVAIGTIYAARAAASMLARVPAGLAANRVSNAQLIIAALCVDAIASFALAATGSPVGLGVAAIVDGLAFGVFLASSQSLVAEESAPTARGSAMGVYGTAGAAGEAVGALCLGLVAHLVDPRAVFAITGLLLAASLPVVLYLLRPAGDAAASAAS
jgi:MFS family permease